MMTLLHSAKTTGLARHRRRRRTTPLTVFSGTIFRLRPRVELMEERTLLSTFLVNNTGDSGPGSLRQAILESNGATGATNTIDFGIPGSGVQTIMPLSSLPTIANPVLIDGESQPGYAGMPLIEINGSQAGVVDGLTITAPNVTVRGLDIDNFSVGYTQGAGIHITGTAATGDWVYGNFLGTDPTGTQSEPNNYGVEIDAGATQNLIGTNGDGVTDAAERNVISGNDDNGVEIQSSDNNVDCWEHDRDGCLGSGSRRRSTRRSVWRSTPARGTRSAGRSPGPATSSRAIRSSGVQIKGSSDNLIEGDFIGIDVTGTKLLVLGNPGNANDIEAGVALTNASDGNTIGGTAAGAADVISGNSGSKASRSAARPIIWSRAI